MALKRINKELQVSHCATSQLTAKRRPVPIPPDFEEWGRGAALASAPGASALRAHGTGLICGPVPKIGAEATEPVRVVASQKRHPVPRTLPPRPGKHARAFDGPRPR